ncbi:hypothetical protein Tco_0058403 [Tanacetum coccineum]
MQAEEQEILSIEEKSKLFVQLLEARKKHFAAMRAQENRNKPPTKAQKRKTMSTYLKNIAGYKHNQLKNKSFDDVQNKVKAEGSEIREEGSSKKAGEDMEGRIVGIKRLLDDLEVTVAKVYVTAAKLNTMASAIICLATNQKFNFSKYIFERMVKNLDNAVKFLMKQKSRRPKEKDTEIPQFNVPSDPTNVVDKAVNEEPSMQLKELMDFCTKLQQRVLDLENTKTAQAQEITSLKKRVKKLEKKGGSRTHKLKRLYRVGRSARVVSSEEASLGDKEDASKQGRKIHDIDKDAEITLVDETQGRYGDEDMFGVHDLDGDEVVVESKVTDKAGEKRNIVEEAIAVTDAVIIPVSAATITNVELTLAQTLVELKSARPKKKGVVMQEPSESTPTISLQLPSQVNGQGSKDKGKAKMIEPEKPLKKKYHIKFDEEEALRLQAKFDEEDRLAREKAQQVEEANIAWDDIQAKIDADYQLAERLQAQEQQELTIEEKSTLFVQLLEKRKKHFAAKRAEEKRNRPPTRAQQRNIMCTYLKNMAGWKPKDLKNKSFANIQELFDKAFKRVNTFVDFRTELVEGTEMEESSKKAEVMEESSSKRAGDELQQESTKKQKMDDDQERAELQSLMNVIPDEEEVAVDAIPLATKPPSIVDWKIVKEGKISYYQIIRADGSSRRYSAFIQMLRSFDREDLETLWKLVKAKHGYTRLEEGYERVLWGDLKTMFEHHVEDAGRIVGIKRLRDDLRVTAVKLVLLVQKLLLLVLKVNAAGIKVTTAERLQLLKG